MNPSTFRTNLKTLLDARPNLTSIDCQVFRYPPGAKADVRPTLFLTEWRLDQIDGTLLPSSTIDRTYVFDGLGHVETAGAQESQWGTAEATASTLITELEATLLADQTVSGACTQARLASASLTPSTDGQKRVFMDIEFSIAVRDVS